MKIEDFKLNGTQNMEDINPFITFSREEYEKQMIEEMMLKPNFNENIYRNYPKE